MQNLNRATMEYISTSIKPGVALVDLRKLCEEYMLSHVEWIKKRKYICF